jgi:Transglycosylase-like domain
MTSWIKRILVIAAIFLFAAACTPQELKAFYDQNGIDTSHMSEADLTAQAAAITDYMNHQMQLHQYDSALSDDALARLRQCESTNNYGAVSASGTFRGAYQFSQQTWNGVANSAFGGQYSGWDPAGVPAYVQDSFARALYAQRGRAPWPVCGSRI